MATVIKAGNVASGAQVTSDATGILQFNTGSGAGTAAVTIDTSQNVGVGTASPTTRFQVSGSTGNGLSYTDGTVTNYIGTSGSSIGVVGTLTNHPSLFIVNGTERMRLDIAGNLGLGVTPSTVNTLGSYKSFEVGQAGNAIYAGNNQVIFGSNTKWDGGTAKYAQTYPATIYDQANGAHRWYIAPSGTANANITFTQAMTLDASGNLGVGSTSPASRIDVNGKITLRNGSDSRLGYIQNTGGAVFIGSETGGTTEIVFQTNGPTERARIDSSGNLMVGFSTTATTSCVFFKPVGEQGTTYQPIAQFGVSGTFNVSYGGRWRWYTSTGNGSVFKNGYNLQLRTFDDGSTTEATAATVTYQTWFQGNNSASWSTTSDERVKTNIRPINNALSKICALKPCHFEMKNELGVTKTNFIAQEFEQVFPGHVSEVTTPDEYKEFTDSSTIKAVDVNLIPYLTAAIQELTAKVEAQAAELAALKGAA